MPKFSNCTEYMVTVISSIMHLMFSIDIITWLTWVIYVQVSLEDLQFFYMEESGDLRSSSICDEMRQTLRRAVSHFQDLSRTPVQKVHFSSLLRKVMKYLEWVSWLSLQSGFCWSDLANVIFLLYVIYVYIKELA